MRRTLLVLLCLVLLLGGCRRTRTRPDYSTYKTSESSASSAAEENAECPTLARGQEILDAMEQELREQYTDEFFENEFWESFVEGYWRGFEETHQYCKFCYEE